MQSSLNFPNVSLVHHADEVKMLCSNNASEILGANTQRILDKYGIKRINTAPHVHYMNPVECAIQTINRIAVLLLANAKFTYCPPCILTC